jgi:hypothetical protein
MGAALVAKYMAEAAPTVQSATVEWKVRGQIAGVNVQGMSDARQAAGEFRNRGEGGISHGLPVQAGAAGRLAGAVRPTEAPALVEGNGESPPAGAPARGRRHTA